MSMATNNEKWIATWSRIREGGVSRFIILRELLAFGLTYGAVIYVADTYLLRNQVNPITLCIQVVFAGLLFGTFMWHYCERRYRKLAEKMHNHQLVRDASIVALTSRVGACAP